MAGQTPEQFINSIKGSGLLIVRGDNYYFVPLTMLSQCIFPGPFLKDADGISIDFFEKENIPQGPAGTATTKGQVHKRMEQLLGDFRVVDGVSQAIWISEQQVVAGKKVSKSENSNQLLFRYSGDGKKIVVDMSKGGKPSNS